MRRIYRFAALIAALALFASACGAEEGSTPDDSDATEPTAGDATTLPADGVADGGQVPTASFEWGEFELADGIAGKLNDGESINVVLSFQTLGDVLAPALLTAGMERAAEELSEEHGVQIDTRLIGPTETDPPAQIAEVQSLTGASQVDCLGVQPVTPDAFVDVINQAVEAGIPTFTVNTDSPESKRFAYYGLDEVAAGQIAGEFTLQWAEQNAFQIDEPALTTGDTTASWAQDRMRGWVDVVTEAFPDVAVVGTPTDALTTTYDPAEVYSTTEAFLNGHPDVDFIFHTDWGAKTIGPLVTQMERQDQIGVLGFNVDADYLDAIENGDIIGTVDQAFDNQAEAFVHGCIDFLLDGQAPDDPIQHVNPVVISLDNLAEQREKFESIVGS